MFQSLINIIKDSDISTAGEWDYIVRIVLVEGENLLSMDDNGLSDPYVRFKLQNEKYKTKVSKLFDYYQFDSCLLTTNGETTLKSFILRTKMKTNDCYSKNVDETWG